jgi:hypothetical protein
LNDAIYALSFWPVLPCEIIFTEEFLFPCVCCFESSNEMSAQEGRLLGWLEGNLLSACLKFTQLSYLGFGAFSYLA